MIPLVDLKQQYQSIKKEIDSALARVMESGWFILGEELRSFEKEFAAYCRTKYAAGVGSGTEALHLSLLACGIKPGDKVITVPNTATPTASAISFANAIPVFIDVDPETFTMDPNRLDDFLSRERKTKTAREAAKTKAIIPVHLYGHPAEMSFLLEIAQRRNLAVIEDACQAHGAEYHQRRVGSLAHAGCFSFYPTKNLGAFGDGGMVVSDDGELIDTIHKLRNYGEASKYHNVIAGFNSRLDELQAAMLRIKLKHLDRWNTSRRINAGLYKNMLQGCQVTLPTEKDYARHVYHLYVIKTQKRDRLKAYLKSQNILTSVHYPTPIHLQPAFRDLGYEIGDFPVSENLSAEILTLPMFAELDEKQITSICLAIKDFEKQNSE